MIAEVTVSGYRMAPEKTQLTLEETVGAKRQRDEGEDTTKDNANGSAGKDAGQAAPQEPNVPEPKQQKLSAAPKSVLEEGRIYFYYR